MHLHFSCDCGREYAFSIDEADEEVTDEEEEAAPVDASHQKEADYVAKPDLEVDATPSYEDPNDPFWEEDEADANETRIHETSPIELRPRPVKSRPGLRKTAPFGFARPQAN